MTPTKETQSSRVLKLLRAKKVVTNTELNNICFRYSARIHELRNDGWLIDTKLKAGGLTKFIFMGHVDDEPMEYED